MPTEHHSETASEILIAETEGWKAIELALIFAAHSVARGQVELTDIARRSVDVVHRAGYRSLPDGRKTRFLGTGITNFQTTLYVVNTVSSWHFPDPVLLVGWLVECGGPRMDRGPARADFEANGVDLMIGGTRWRYNNKRYGHGGDGLPESRAYDASECVHVRSVPPVVLARAPRKRVLSRSENARSRLE